MLFLQYWFYVILSLDFQLSVILSPVKGEGSSTLLNKNFCFLVLWLKFKKNKAAFYGAALETFYLFFRFMLYRFWFLWTAPQ